MEVIRKQPGTTYEQFLRAGGRRVDHDAWRDPEGLIARLEAEANAIADDENALIDQDRATKLADIRERILAIERDEEALLEGSHLPRRADTDPRALLSLSIEGPPPKEQWV